MLNSLIKIILIILLVFTPIAFGSIEIWAFSLMELGILLIIVLYVLQQSFLRPSSFVPRPSSLVSNSGLPTPNSELYNSAFVITLLSLFLVFIFFQMVPLPPEVLKIVSPKSYELRTHLLDDQLFLPAGLSPQAFHLAPISLFPFATKIEFFKWLTLIGLFFLLGHWKLLNRGQRATKHLLITVILVGVAESFYGIFEFFSGHRHILYLEGSSLMSSVTGTFINRNCFAGYLLMVIPLGMGFLFSREAAHSIRWRSWRHRLASLDGKDLLLAFGVILMILGLLFSASRMGILSLLLSFTLISLLFINPAQGRRFSRTAVLLFALALLWAAWIGLDAVISRFFTASEDFQTRWQFWVSTFQILKDFPQFGSGLGTFAQIFPMYRTFPVYGFVTHAENDFLQLASETGLLGIGLLFLVFLFLFIKTVSGIRSLAPGEPQRYIALGGLVGVLALMLHSLVERNIQVPANAFLFTFLWALVLKHSIKSHYRNSR